MQDFLISEKEMLLQLIAGKRPRFSGKIKLELPQLSPEDNAIYSRKFNNWYEPCGCELGAVFAFVAIGSFLIYTVFFANMVDWPLIRNGLIFLFSAAAIGKIIGILSAKLLLRRTINKLAARL